MIEPVEPIQTQRPSRLLMSSVALVIIILFSVGVSTLLARRTPKQVVKKTNGTAQYSFSLPAGQTAMTPKSETTLTLTASNLGQVKIDGLQIIARFSGSVPKNMTFTPAPVSGLSVASQSIIDDEAGKKLTVAYVTSSPSTPFTSTGEPITLGTLSFESPERGTMTVTIDPQWSKILQSVTGTDILANPSPVSFSIEP